jgi:UDP-glucose 4-epimerase
MKNVITGGLGFIGSNLAEHLLALGEEVLIIDDLSTGDLRYGDSIKNHPNLSVFQADILKLPVEELSEKFRGAQSIYHLAANADVRGGWENPYVDLNQNICVTHKVAEAARRSFVGEVIYSSTGCVYGEPDVIPTPEHTSMPVQTSLYGATKLGGEGILSAYALNGAFKLTIFRFVSVLGKNYHHGHVIDFVRKLQQDASKLEILGDGTQRKSYIHVLDCVKGLANLRGEEPIEIFNIGHDYYISVTKSAEIISSTLKMSPTFILGKEDRGWIGDNPFTFLDIAKAKGRGWEPTLSIEESLVSTVTWLIENAWVIERDSGRKKS